MWCFYYFHFEMNYDILKSKNTCILFNKNITFNKIGIKNGKSHFQNIHTFTYQKTLLIHLFACFWNCRTRLILNVRNFYYTVNFYCLLEVLLRRGTWICRSTIIFWILGFSNLDMHIQGTYFRELHCIRLKKESVLKKIRGVNSAINSKIKKN